MNGLAANTAPLRLPTPTRTAASTASGAPARLGRPNPPAGRDLVIDLARIGAVVFVVIVHVAFAGVRLGDGGAIAVEKTVTLAPWFTASTWVAQVMPLFFVVGGYATAVALRSARARGESDAAYVRGRLLRLARPALPVFIAFAAGLLVATALPIDQSLARGVAVVVGSPLWFLAAFGIVQSAAPLLFDAHARRPVATLAMLVIGAAAVDTARNATGIAEIGLVNLLFVWAAIHQIGFWMRDGWFARRSRRTLVAIVAGAYAIIGGIVAAGWASPDLLANQFPPMLPLIPLGIAQAAGLQLARPLLERLVQVRAVQAVMFFVGTRAMTIYCWHSPVILLLLGLQLLVPATLSDPGSERWWLERIPFTLLVFVVLWLIGRPLARFETAPAKPGPGDRLPGLIAVMIACGAFITGPLLVAVFGMNLALAVIGLAGVAAALALTRLRGA